MNSKYIECCEVLTALHSYLKNAELGEQEKDWFTLFSASFLSILYENNKLCKSCIKFYQVVDSKVGDSKTK